MTDFLDPNLSIFPGVEGDRAPWATPNGCGCITCVDEVLHKTRGVGFPFIVCDKCGDKRCPRGAYHVNICQFETEEV